MEYEVRRKRCASATILPHAVSCAPANTKSLRPTCVLLHAQPPHPEHAIERRRLEEINVAASRWRRGRLVGCPAVPFPFWPAWS